MGYRLKTKRYQDDIQEFFSIGKWSEDIVEPNPTQIYCILVLMDLLRKIKKIAKKHGHSVYLSSGYRCKAHNEKAGGKPESQHLYMEAIDVSISDVEGFLLKAKDEITPLLKEHFIFQALKYNWGIHFGIETQRVIAAGKTRKNNLFS